MTDRVLIGLSGGINSMAVLCWLSEQPVKPKELHLFYAHFKEHSSDTFQFVADGIRFARKNFETVKVKITKNSIIQFCRDNNMIPHPKFSPCSRKLKIEVAATYAFDNDITVDLIGYVKHELKRRTSKAKAAMKDDMFGLQKLYPIGEFTDEWCFEIVDKYIGWHPAIYDIVDSEGKRVFKHNNCLPCIKMKTEEFEDVKTYFPAKHYEAMRLSSELGKYWGRDEAIFYSTFGRDEGQQPCEVCTF